MNEWVRKAIQRLQGRMTQTRIREKRFFLLREPFCFVIQLEMDSGFDETLLVFDKTHLTGDTEAPYFLYGCAFLQKDDDPRHLAELGVTGLECTLRVARRVDSDDALDAFLQEAFAQFDAWEAEGKEGVQGHSRQMRKAFMQDITGLLKPLGFRKSSNSWVHPWHGRLLLKFHAQKSAYSDSYYLRFYICHGSINCGCVCYDVTPGSAASIDWQLTDRAFVRQAVEELIENYIGPLLKMSLEELQNQKEALRKRVDCGCRICEDCWLLEAAD